MKKLLVPLDGSETGEVALPWAKCLAAAGGQTLELLRTYSSLATVYTYPDFATPPPVAYDLSGFLRHCQKYLELTTQQFGLEATTRVVEGEAAERIVELSQAEEIDAIVLSSHGRGGLGRWLLGSVATQVVRGCSKPVFVVKAGPEERPEPRIQKIVVALDGSKLSEEGLNKAVELASAHKASLTLYQAVEQFSHPVVAYQVPIEHQEKTARDYLQELKIRHPEVEISTVVEVAQPAQGVLGQSRSHDLVVMTSHGWSGFERWLLGSVCEKVLHRCQTPLLVVHGNDEE